MSPAAMALSRYYAHVSNDDFDQVLALFAPDVKFAIVLPDGTVRGDNRNAIVDYLESRGSVVRQHIPRQTAAVGDVQFVYGDVVDNGTDTVGHFLSCGRINEEGLIAAYQVTLEPELDLLARTQ